jgi:hypothetical protein
MPFPATVTMIPFPAKPVIKIPFPVFVISFLLSLNFLVLIRTIVLHTITYYNPRAITVSKEKMLISSVLPTTYETQCCLAGDFD